MKRTIVLVFALSVTLAALLSAHGNEPHIRGTVVSATDTSIVVKTAGGASQTLAIDSSTKVLRGKTKGSLQDVKVGDRVVVHVMKHPDHLMAEEIDLPVLAAKKAK
jgi:hypothetical protein